MYRDGWWRGHAQWKLCRALRPCVLKEQNARLNRESRRERAARHGGFLFGDIFSRRQIGHAGGDLMRKPRPRFAVIWLFSLGLAFIVGIDKPTRSQDRRLAFEQIVGHPRGLPQLPPQGAGAK